MSERKINWNELKGLSDQEIEQKAKDILSLMTIREKVWQMVGDMPAMSRYNQVPIPSGVDKAIGIPGILFSDGPRGVVVGNSTCFPVSPSRSVMCPLTREKTM